MLISAHSELTVSSKAEIKVDKKGNTMSIRWKWLGHLKNNEVQIKTASKTKKTTRLTTSFFIALLSKLTFCFVLTDKACLQG